MQPQQAPLVPASFAQARLWFLDQYEPNSPIYNQCQAFHLHGPLDRAALEAALNAVVRRHESLRTTLVTADGQPMQRIAQESSVRLDVTDLSSSPPEGREDQVLAWLAAQQSKPFDLEHGPLLRAGLLRFGDQEHVLALAVHHIVSDEWSLQILNRELSALYQVSCAGEAAPSRLDVAALPELSLQYADYSAWQRQWLQGERLQKQLTYWRQQLQGAPPLLDLPTDRARPAFQTYAGDSVTRRWPGALWSELRALSLSCSATLFMTCLSAWAILLHRYSGQNEVLIGTPIANRRLVEWENLIGFFANTLVLRIRLSGNPTFRQLLMGVADTALDAYDHQDLPFERLVEELQPERSTSHSPLFQVMFTVDTIPQSPLRLPGLAVSPIELHERFTRFELSMRLRQSDTATEARLLYNSDLFDRATAQRMLDHYGNLLQAIITHPDRRIGRLRLLTTEEREHQLSTWIATGPEPADTLPVPRRFASQAQRTPDATAIVGPGLCRTYGQLDAESNRLARYLLQHGAGPEKVIGICLEPSPELVTAVLAVLKSGAAYLPLEPADPPERVRFMLGDAGVLCVLTKTPFAALVTGAHSDVICLDADASDISWQTSEALPSVTEPHHLAYVLYTSGSTGRPKGAMVEHGNLSNYLAWVTERLLPGGVPRLPLLTRFSFDACLKQLLAPLLVGASVWLLPPDALTEPRILLAELSARPHSGLNCVPSLWQTLLEAMEADPSLRPKANFSHLLLGGEAIPVGLLERTLAILPHIQVWNLYGPTEATANVAAGPVGAGERVGIGQPVANTALYILDAYGDLAPTGVPGELCVGGCAVARGYLKRPDLTAEAFVPDPFWHAPGARLYRTGDRARYTADGRIELLGRRDDQIKLRGYRVELGEIEHTLLQHAEVAQVAVVLHSTSERGSYLVAFVVLRGRTELERRSLVHFLQQRLPSYMIPSGWLQVESLPLTASGKLDRRALLGLADAALRPESDQTCPPSRDATLTALEELVAGIWRELLGIEQVGPEDDFFDLGGHSLLVTRVLSRVQAMLGVAVPVRTFFERPTVSGLALAIAQRLPNAGAESSSSRHSGEAMHE